MTKKQGKGSNGSKDTPSVVHEFLGHEMRVELTDGRVIVGTLIAYEGCGDLLFQAAVEQRGFKDGAVTLRNLSLLAIPFKYVKRLHRRVPGKEPIRIPVEGPTVAAQ